ncbi:hypothetical protein ACIBI4_08845 [Streptomyces sp. NPDC050418]|uniref:hypothetical protein n=1 Tax=Streptomyces sp. NPDC050418 TaxID=3365612 RepID=UPI00379E7711
MKRNFASRCAAVVALGAAAVACTAAPPQTEPARQPQPALTTEATGCLERYGHPYPAGPDYRTSLDRDSRIRYDNAYRACRGGRDLSAQELAGLERAAATLTARCMREAGYTYRPPRVRADTLRTFPYVVDDPAWAARNGYGGKGHVRPAAPRDPAAARALLGAPAPAIRVTAPDGSTHTRTATGCRAEAEARLYGNLPAHFRATTVLAHPQGGRERAERIVTGTRAWRTALPEWARCMATAGHPYASPQAARAAVRDASSRTRKATAVAEARCARGSGLAEAATEAGRHARDRAEAPYLNEVVALNRMRLEALERVRGAAR